MKPLAVVVLAAGQGTRMKSEHAKVLHKVLGKPMLAYSVDLARSLKPERVVVVVGVQGGQVKDAFREKGVSFAVQKEQKGTAHAVMAAMPALKGFTGDVLVLYGDTPLMKTETAKKIVSMHRRSKAVLTLLTARVDKPFGYGRIVRGKGGKVERIIEEKDCTAAEREISEVNPGLYCYKMDFLKKSLPKIKTNNKQGEYYLTDLLEIAAKSGHKISSTSVYGDSEILGVNSRWELSRAEEILRERINQAHAMAGVSIQMPGTVWIEPGVKLGKDVLIEPNVRITGGSSVGAGSVIEAGSRIEDSRIGPRVRIKANSVLEGSEVKEGAQVGPMAHLRPGSSIGKNARIGNYVETKKAVIGDGSKCSHLTYVGDAVIGKNVNIGCGFITCNYDGVEKHKTVIGDDVFVGSDSQAVAPVKIGKGAYIGSGSTITRDVPPGALVLTRAPEVVKEGWAKKKKAADKKKKKAKKKAAGRKK